MTSSTNARRHLRILVADDSADDAELTITEVKRHFEVTHERVETGPALRQAILEHEWELILCDYSMPTLDAPAALAIIKESAIDTPTIVVSGTIGEDAGIQVLTAGAADFIVKGKYSRLFPAIERELREAATRRRRREVERSLAASEQRFRTLVQSMNDLVFTLDAQQKITGVYGQSIGTGTDDPEALLGKDISHLLGNDFHGVHRNANARALGGESVFYEWSDSSGEGPRHFQTSLSPVASPEGTPIGLVGVVKDTTEQTKLRAHLMASDRMASVGVLAAGVAHEINNPLSAVTGNLDIAAEFMAQLSGPPEVLQEFSELIRDAREGAQRVHRIVRDVKIFSRAKEEKKRVPVDVEDVLESSLRMARNEIRHRARLTKDFARVPAALADESQLGQVFMNLIINAAQAIPEGRAETNEIGIRTRVDRLQKMVVVDISDTGSGMSAEVQKNIFTPFFTTKPAGIGTGLGLPICKRIVAELNGEMAVRSTEGKGSTFTVTLPLAASTPSMEIEAAIASGLIGRRGQILVVDDDPMVANIVRRILKAQHDVTTLESAAAAIAVIESGKRFDAILCDIMMPEMTGIDLYRHLARTVPGQAESMIFMSGGLFTSNARAFLDEVTNARIEKPFDARRLQSLVADQVK